MLALHPDALSRYLERFAMTTPVLPLDALPDVPGGMTSSVKAMIRLDSQNQDAGVSVTFVWAYPSSDPETPGLITRQLEISYADWVDLGEPDILTVTVEPGDQVAEESAEEAAETDD